MDGGSNPHLAIRLSSSVFRRLSPPTYRPSSPSQHHAALVRAIAPLKDFLPVLGHADYVPAALPGQGKYVRRRIPFVGVFPLGVIMV